MLTIVILLLFYYSNQIREKALTIIKVCVKIRNRWKGGEEEIGGITCCDGLVNFVLIYIHIYVSCTFLCVFVFAC